MNGVIGTSSAIAITVSSYFSRSADVLLSLPNSRRLFIFRDDDFPLLSSVQLESDLPGTPGPENDGVNDGRTNRRRLN